jgi:GWxTD domain-containing protein
MVESRQVIVALAALLPGGAAMAQRSATPPVAVHVIRFFHPASGSTTVEGLLEVPLSSLGAAAGAAVTRYRVEVSVQDSAGLTLHQSEWERELPASIAREEGAAAVESFRFVVAPGRYRLLARAVPATGTGVEGSAEVRAWGARPVVSDLLLATAARQVAGDTASVGAGEVRRGDLAMRTGPVPMLTLTDATLMYYAEVYPWPGAPAEVELRLEVVDSTSRRLVMTPARALRIGGSGGATRGSLDLSGLPVGRYRLRLHLRLGDSNTVADAPFGMAEPVAGSDPVAATASDMFESASEALLDSLYAPLVYLLEESERGLYQTLSTDGKRRFLQEFWRRRDPSPQTPDNPARDVFYAGVSHANQAFREGGAAQIPGWRTDRGRVYLRNGRPDDVLQRPQGAPRPYEVWRYTRGRPRFYVFWDRSGVGHYELIHTSDPAETGHPAWETLLGSGAFDDVARFLNMTGVR